MSNNAANHDSNNQSAIPAIMTVLTGVATGGFDKAYSETLGSLRTTCENLARELDNLDLSVAKLGNFGIALTRAVKTAQRALERIARRGISHCHKFKSYFGTLQVALAEPQPSPTEVTPAVDGLLTRLIDEGKSDFEEIAKLGDELCKLLDDMNTRFEPFLKELDAEAQRLKLEIKPRSVFRDAAAFAGGVAVGGLTTTAAIAVDHTLVGAAGTLWGLGGLPTLGIFLGVAAICGGFCLAVTIAVHNHTSGKCQAALTTLTGLEKEAKKNQRKIDDLNDRIKNHVVDPSNDAKAGVAWLAEAKNEVVREQIIAQVKKSVDDMETSLKGAIADKTPPMTWGALALGSAVGGATMVAGATVGMPTALVVATGVGAGIATANSRTN